MKRVRKKKLDKGAEARRLARKLADAPANTRVIPDKRKRPERHKLDLFREEL
jgi:hypothetical protein